MRLSPQPSGWTERGAHEVVDGINRIPVPLPLAGMPAVNCYVVEGPDGLVLVDPGWASDQAEEALSAGLAELGRQVEEISRRSPSRTCTGTTTAWPSGSRSACRTCGWGWGWGEADAFDLVADGEVFSQRQIHALSEHASGNLVDWAATQPRDEHEIDVPFESPDVWYRDGGELPLIDGSLTAWETPGHTRGHVVLPFAGAPPLFTGDHVLPLATPAIGFEFNLASHAISDYLTSLRWLLHEAEMVMLPLYGPVGGSVQHRVRRAAGSPRGASRRGRDLPLHRFSDCRRHGPRHALDAEEPAPPPVRSGTSDGDDGGRRPPGGPGEPRTGPRGTRCGRHRDVAARGCVRRARWISV